MTNRQENKYSMYLTLKAYLAKQKTITDTLPTFSALITQLNTAISQIDGHRNVQETDRTGIAENKQLQRANLEKAALEISKRLYAFAKVSKNTSLAAEVKTTLSNLESLADTTLVDRATLYYNRAQTNIGNLAGYLVTAASQTAYNTLITNYQATIPTPRLGQTDRSNATDGLDQGFDLADSTIDLMDVLVDIVQNNQPTFYKNYYSARKIINLGSKRVAFRAKAADAEGNPVGKALFSIMTVNTQKIASATPAKPLVKKTGVKGQFRLKALAAGAYQITITKTGFKPKTISHTQVEGEMSKLEVVLEVE